MICGKEDLIGDNVPLSGDGGRSRESLMRFVEGREYFGDGWRSLVNHRVVLWEDEKGGRYCSVVGGGGKIREDEGGFRRMGVVVGNEGISFVE